MRALAFLLFALSLTACSVGDLPCAEDEFDLEGECLPTSGSVFAERVLEVSLGEGGGFGESGLPDVILGGPRGFGDAAGGVDVLSLGYEGSVTLLFDHVIQDESGPEFIVFENAFVDMANGEVFREACGVEVALGEGAFTSFECLTENAPPNGCAGQTPVYARDDNGIAANDIDAAGGDAFDIETIAVQAFDRVRIRDLSSEPGEEPTHGCDLDAVVLVRGDLED